jgi:plasmid stabilization system protein ParE
MSKRAAAYVRGLQTAFARGAQAARNGEVIRDAAKRYWRTPEGREAVWRYRRSPKGREAQ